MSHQDNGRVCFLVCPIGDEDTPVRHHADQLFEHIVEPAARECHYKCLRADKVSKPGMINIDVIEHLLQDQLVVADLSGQNPNVFYELAIRHASNKPVVQMIKSGEEIPFHLAQCRTIKFSLDLDSAPRARSELARQIRATDADQTTLRNPFSVALSVMSMRKSDNPLERTNAEIVSSVHDLFSELNTRFSYLESRVSRLADRLSERVESLKQTEKTIIKLANETTIKPAERPQTPEKLSHPPSRKARYPPGPWSPGDDE